MTNSNLVEAGVYERRVPVSEARIWENVFDFEHLPWLHRSSFSSLTCLEKGDWGWRAELRQTAAPERISIMEIKVEREARRYVSRILSGFGEGTEIWTHLMPVDARQTDIRVAFNLPIADRAKAARIGEAYKQLYANLWDEDLEMMLARQNYLDRRPRADTAVRVLGSPADVRGKLPMTVTLGEERFRIVEADGRLLAFSCICPHMQGRLDEGDLEGTVVTCPWHGYQFDIASGRDVSGHDLRLRPAPEVVIDEARDEVRLEWPVREDRT